MHSDKLVVFPQDLLETMTIESTLFLPNNEDLGVAILSKQINDHYIAKVYQLSLSEDQQQYNFIQELAVFKYETQDEIDQLITRLPEMSGLEMLIMLNPDRKSTRLNSSHVAISYAVFCLKKKQNHS